MVVIFRRVQFLKLQIQTTLVFIGQMKINVLVTLYGILLVGLFNSNIMIQQVDGVDYKA